MMTFNQVDREALQVGSKVGVIGPHSAAVLTVAKRTAAQLVLSDESRWTIKTGRKFGDSGYYSSDLVSEQDARERIEHIRQERSFNQAVNRMNRMRWRDLTPEQLAQLEAISTTLTEATTEITTETGTV